MREKIHYKIYAVFQYFFYILLLLIGLLIFILLSLIRLKLLEYFDFNIIVHYILLPLFLSTLSITYYIVYKYIFKIKRRYSEKLKKYERPSYIEIYGEDFKRPTMEEFGLSFQEYQIKINRLKKDSKVKEYQKALNVYFKIQEEKNTQNNWF